MKPSKREQEILDLLQEECAEVIAIISKIRRFGYDCNWKGGDTNIVQLLKELQDVEILKEEIRNSVNWTSVDGYDAYTYENEKVFRLKQFTTIFESENDS